MEKNDRVLIKDIIPNISVSNRIAKILGTEVKIEDINETEIKVKDVWIPKDFVKEVTFKHYTEEELERRSKVEEYHKRFLKENVPFSLKVCEFIDDYFGCLLGSTTMFWIVAYLVGSVIREASPNSNFGTLLIIIGFCSLGVAVLSSIAIIIFLLIIERRLETPEKFFKEARTKTIKHFRLSKEEMERLDICL